MQILLAMIRVSKKELKTLLGHDDIEISQSQIDTSWVEILYAKEQRLKQLRRRRYSGIAAAILVFLGVGSFWTLKQETPQLTPIELYALESRGADDAAAAGHISLSTNRDNVIEVESDNANFDYSIRGAIVIDVDTMKIVDEPVRAYNTLKVPAGKRASLSLSDGSRIILNSRSRLVYPIAINSGKREVYLEGEAYFDIAKDVNNPFSVHTDRCVATTTARATILYILFAEIAASHAKTMLLTGAVTLMSIQPQSISLRARHVSRSMVWSMFWTWEALCTLSMKSVRPFAQGATAASIHPHFRELSVGATTAAPAATFVR